MNVLLFGASGMVGQGVLRECLLDADVKLVQILVRTATGLRDAKLREVIRKDLKTYLAEADLSGFDACFFCLGVSSAGMTEMEYEQVTYGLTMAAAEPLSRQNPRMTFVYVSGGGTDSTEKGRVMWARVKGKTENALLGLPFRAAYMFRPGIIQPVEGATSKTMVYRVFYSVAKPLLPLLRWAFPDHILTTKLVGQAMLEVAKHGYPRRVMESRDIRAAAATGRG